MATRARQIAKFMGKTETANSSNAALSTIDSSVVTTIVNASALDSAMIKDIPLLVFSSFDSLPAQNLEAGDKAPAFSLLNQDGDTVSLSDFAGKNIIFWFYPRASTPG